MWVDVTVERPPFLRKVLFHWICPGGNKNVSMGYHCEEGWDIYLPYHSYPLRTDIINVTHWMELPEFPVDETKPHMDVTFSDGTKLKCTKLVIEGAGGGGGSKC